MRPEADRNKVVFFLICLWIGLFLSQGLAAQTEKEKKENSQKIYDIENCVNPFNPEKSVKSETGYQYWFIDKDFIDGRTIKMSVVSPHQSTHAPHKHASDEFFFILEGKATFFLNGESATVGPYTSLYCPANVMHGISNSGDTELKYLVIKKY